MASSGAIIRPFSFPAGTTGKTAVIVSNEGDLLSLRDCLGIDEKTARRFLMSRLYSVDGASASARLSVIGPVIGAPYAVILAETLIASGAETILFFGWCGSLSAGMKTGELLLPDGALADEGISRHYQKKNGSAKELPDLVRRPSSAVVETVRNSLAAAGLRFHEGLVWTTDAIFRETPEKIAWYQGRQALAVEMEVSALFSVAAFRQVSVAAVLVVSDELFTLTWQPGFGQPEFIAMRQKIAEVISRLWETR